MSLYLLFKRKIAIIMWFACYLRVSARILCVSLLVIKKNLAYRFMHGDDVDSIHTTAMERICLSDQ